MKTILCPVDFSPNATAAVRYAMAMNGKLKARIILLHAYETPVLFSEPAFLTGRFTDSSIHNTHLKKLQAFQAKMFGTSKTPKVEHLLVQGLASSRIVEVARQKKADLIVMGTTGTGAGERIIAGSNAARVMRQAPCMVLLVPSRARFSGMDRIVYATDLSDDNLDHAREIAPMAKLFKSEVLYLYVDRAGVTDKQALEKVNEKIRHQKGALKGSGHVMHGSSVAGGIDKFLRQHRAGCLAVYTRHRSVLQEIYHPSLSRKLSLHASVPQLVVHETDHKTLD